MRIVIFGRGRVGSSVAAFAESLGHEAKTLARADADRADPEVARADVVAAAIPDDALDGWLETWRARLAGKRAFHFSGARAVEGLPGYHPLYSFPRSPAPVDELARALIARPRGAAPFASIIPGAQNPEIEIAPEDRALYHALAVVSGNFAAYLLNQTADQFASRFGADPAESLGPYFESVVARFRESPFQSMTGPLARRDAGSVKANLAALAVSPRLADLYRAFLASAWPDYPSRPD